ncbi:MAG TPA: NrfD/PsrC family molybdoenzyme membrane anchor subunit [Thermoanaerobaculia bacterium]|nr:NrfD/PsrC family molybdoenzyme membrane anchor subunit [Thermoanaerobaculia bacterium]
MADITELTVHRLNPMVDPGLHVWGWEIPVYLFLGGLVAGLMILTGVFLLRRRQARPRASWSLLSGLGIALLSLGMLALFLDLEHKAYVWRLYTTFQITSPMSWGAWILLLVYPALLASFLLRVPAALRRLFPVLQRASGWLRGRPGLVRWVAMLDVVFGTLLGIYTGILLSSLGARPLWNSALLGPLFLVSGLSSAAAFAHLVSRDHEESTLLVRADNGFLAAELVLFVLFFVGLLSATQVHIQAARLLLGGPFTAVFWVFVVGVGIVLPLALQLLAVRRRIAHTALAPVLVIAGGLALRFVLVYAGQMSHWR